MACAQEVQGLSSGDVLVLVVNAAAQTAPHQVQALLDRMIRTGSENQATGARVGVLIDDISTEWILFSFVAVSKFHLNLYSTYYYYYAHHLLKDFFSNSYY